MSVTTYLLNVVHHRNRYICIYMYVYIMYIKMCVNIAYMVHKLRIEMLPLAKCVRVGAQ